MDAPQQALNVRMHTLIDAVRDQVPVETAALASEMVDANESPIALDMLSEVLAERSSPVSKEIVVKFEMLATGLGLGPQTVNRLRG